MIETKKYKGFTIEIHRDEFPENPRKDWDNYTQMICFHGSYQLGDEGHGIKSDNYSSWAEMGLELEVMSAVILPIYMYDHSGITINTIGFSCQWDSGQIGWIRILKKDAEKHYPDHSIQQLMDMLKSEVAAYDVYLRGDVVGFIVKEQSGEVLEDATCWGFHSTAEAYKEAIAAIDYHWDEKHPLFTQAGVKVETPA
jgi:hypothetical protein